MSPLSPLWVAAQESLSDSCYCEPVSVVAPTSTRLCYGKQLGHVQPLELSFCAWVSKGSCIASRRAQGLQTYGAALPRTCPRRLHQWKFVEHRQHSCEHDAISILALMFSNCASSFSIRSLSKVKLTDEIITF